MRTAQYDGVIVTGKQKTVAEAIRARLGENADVRGAHRSAAAEIGVDPSRFSRWLNDDAEPGGEALDGLRKWLGLRSVYDLGPYLVATKLRVYAKHRAARGLPPAQG